MTKNLFLDDERNPKDVDWGPDPSIYHKYEWDVVRTYEEFVKWVEQNGVPDRVSFDNDIQTELEGYDCAKWLVNYCLDKKEPPKLFYAHTQNNVNRIQILGTLYWTKKNFDKFF